MKEKFLYQSIASDLIEKIKAKTYKKGDLLESSTILMGRYNASIVTINKALGHLASLGYIKRIPGKGSVVTDYSATDNSSNGSGMIGAVVFDMAQPDIWAGAVKAMENHLYPLDYQLLVGNNSGSLERMLEYIDQFASQGVEGIVFVPISGDSDENFQKINSTIVDHIKKFGIPFVVLHRILKKVDTVQIGFDNHQDSLELMDTLFSHGCRHPLLLSYDFFNSVISDRERGFRESLWTRKILNPEDLIARIPNQKNWANEQPDFLGFLRKELTNHPETDAIIAIDDYILKLLHVVEQSGTVFKDHPYILSGFGTIDDSFSSGAIDMYQRQDPSILGKVAITRLLEMINRTTQQITQTIRIPSSLTFGKSDI
jgi:DNA-binding LacI/PurR family transcriptional regulator